MTTSQPDGRVSDFVEQYLTFLDDDGPEPDIDVLPEELRAEAFRVLRMLDVFAPEPVEMPALEDDPIARRFGFDRAEPELSISTGALKDFLADRGLSATDLAQRLTAAGRDTTVKEIFSLVQRGGTVMIDRDLAARLAAILSTSVADFESAAPAPASETERLLSAIWLRERVEQFAARFGMGVDAVEAELRPCLSALAFRNENDDARVAALDVALEEIRREHNL